MNISERCQYFYSACLFYLCMRWWFLLEKTFLLFYCRRRRGEAPTQRNWCALQLTSFSVKQSLVFKPKYLLTFPLPRFISNNAPQDAYLWLDPLVLNKEKWVDFVVLWWIFFFFWRSDFPELSYIFFSTPNISCLRSEALWWCLSVQLSQSNSNQCNTSRNPDSNSQSYSRIKGWAFGGKWWNVKVTVTSQITFFWPIESENP